MHIVVDTPSDILSGSDGLTSLREAVETAATLQRAVLISFDPMVFGVFSNPDGSVTRVLAITLEERLVIPEGAEILIDGALADGFDIAIQGSGDRLIDVEEGARLTLRDVQLSGGADIAANGVFGFNEIARTDGGVSAETNDGERGNDGNSSELGGAVGDTAVAGIQNNGHLTLERVSFNGLTAVGGNGGLGGEGGDGGNGGDARSIQTIPTGEIVSVTPPSGFVYDNYNPVVTVSSPVGDGGDGGNGGDASDGGGGGTAVGGVLNSGTLILRDAQFTNVSVEGGRGGAGGLAGAGGDGGEESAIVDPGWIVDVLAGGGAELTGTTPTIENYDGIRYSPGLFSDSPDQGLFIRAGVIEVAPGAEYPWQVHGFGNIGIGAMGNGGDGGNGGNGGGGGDAIAAVQNLGNVIVEGAQSQVFVGLHGAGSGGLPGTKGTGGTEGYWFDPRLLKERDIESEWGARPYEWNDSRFAGGNIPGDVGQRGVGGTFGSDGAALFFDGVGAEIADNTVFVEATRSIVEEGEVIVLNFTRAGTGRDALQVGYTLTFGDGLSAADFDGTLPTTGSVAFGPGQTGASVALPRVLADALAEGAETLNVRLDEATAYGIGFTNSATVRIVDPGNNLVLETGTGFADTLFVTGGTAQGRGGDDRIYGSDVNDTLDGGAGDDLLQGGGGNDSLTGGTGADRFSFIDAFGNDTITDFNAAEDRIQIDHSFASLSIAQDGDDARITAPAGDAQSGGSILLLGANAVDIIDAVIDTIDLPDLPTDTIVIEPGVLTAQNDSFDAAGTVLTGNLFDDNGNGADQVGNGATLRLVSASAGDTPLTLGAPVTLPSGGVITLNADGSFAYDPTNAFAGSAGTQSLTYVVTDTANDSGPTTFGATVDIAALPGGPGTNGFVVDGANEGDRTGANVTLAGDVNGDGIDDLLVSAFGENPGTDAGKAYVIYGSASGFALTDGIYDLGTLDFGDGTQGFRLAGIADGDRQVLAVGSGGDINNDGIDDLVISTERGGASPEHRVYVVYGSDSFGGQVNLETIANGDGSAGFAFDPGEQAFGISLDGDINGDGIDDLVIGIERFIGFGAAAVIFGQDGAVSDSILTTNDIRNGDGSQGYILRGRQDRDLAGASVDIVGDMNGDGIDDLVVGAPGANVSASSEGRAFVLFGNASNFDDTDGTIILQDLTEAATPYGFSIDPGPEVRGVGNNVAGIGDINGDGLQDLHVSTSSFLSNKQSVVVLGSSTGFDVTDGRMGTDAIVAGDVTGAFALDNDAVGLLHGAGGDVNGDGISDLLLLDDSGDPDFAPAIQVLFGSSTGFATTQGVVDVDALLAGNPAAGTTLSGFIQGPDGALFTSLVGLSPFLDSAMDASGDINGDGIADIVIGGSFANTSVATGGRSYVVFGRGEGDAPPLDTDSATATINVTLPPATLTGAPMRLTLNEDTALTGTLTGTGPFAIASQASDGTVVLGEDGSFTYTPAANFFGSDSFAASGSGGLSVVDLSVLSVNDAPVAVADSATTDETTPVRIDVTANDTDIEGNALTLLSVSQPDRGSVVIVDGEALFSPDGDFDTLLAGQSTTEAFDVTITDGGLSDTSTVTVNITGASTPPAAFADTASTTEGVAITVDVLANDTAGDAGPLTLISASAINDTGLAPDAVSPVSIVDGQLVYAPQPGSVGADAITYVASDGMIQVSATLTVTIAPSISPPIVAGDFANTDQNTAIVVDVLANDSDPDGDPLTLSGVELAQVTGPDRGLIGLSAGGITYDPNGTMDSIGAGDLVLFDIDYTVTDGTGLSAGILEMTVFGVNDAPTGIDLTATPVPEDATPGTIIGTLNVTDVDSFDSHDLTLLDDAGGLFALDGATLTLAPGAALDFETATSHGIVVQATDGGGLSVQQSLTVAVGDVMDTFGGGDGPDLLIGNNDANFMLGRGGNDTIFGAGGADSIRGGTDDDQIAGGQQDDLIDAGAGDDTAYGGEGDDTIGGNVGHDLIEGRAGNDSLGGGTGRDTLLGGTGDDILGGGQGLDVVSGGIGNDFVAGGGRDDVVDGGAGDDTVNGGSGQDTLTGGSGADLFVFNALVPQESDLIRDFEIGLDHIRLTGVAGMGDIGKFAALTLSDLAVNGEVATMLGYNGHVITMTGVSSEALGVDDFVFI